MKLKTLFLVVALGVAMGADAESGFDLKSEFGSFKSTYVNASVRKVAPKPVVKKNKYSYQLAATSGVMSISEPTLASNKIVYINTANSIRVNKQYESYKLVFSFKNQKKSYSKESLNSIMKRKSIDTVLVRMNGPQNYNYYFLIKPTR